MSVKTGSESDKRREGTPEGRELSVLSGRLGAVEPLADALDRLKGDLASLRASLLSRAEDRGGLALALDRFRSDLADLKTDLSTLQSTTSLALGQLSKEVEERRRRESALETRVKEMESCLTGRLEKVEYTGRRFEVFYDSRPLRMLRRLLAGAPARPNA